MICHTEALERIAAYVATLTFEMTINVEAPSSVEDNLGSADVLGLLADTIKVSPQLSLLTVLISARLHRIVMRFIHHPPRNRASLLPCGAEYFRNGSPL